MIKVQLIFIWTISPKLKSLKAFIWHGKLMHNFNCFFWCCCRCLCFLLLWKKKRLSFYCANIISIIGDNNFMKIWVLFCCIAVNNAPNKLWMHFSSVLGARKRSHFITKQQTNSKLLLNDFSKNISSSHYLSGKKSEWKIMM